MPLQDAAPAAYDLARAEKQHRRQAELARFQELVAVVQRAQALFAAAGVGAGTEALPPWWATSQVGWRTAGMPEPQPDPIDAC